MPFNLRFYAYDDVERKTYHHLLTDIQTSSLVGFAEGKTILLIEQTTGSIARTYVITQQPIVRRHPRGLNEPRQLVDIYVVEEADWQQVTPPLSKWLILGTARPYEGSSNQTK